jgi:hypothetical protein
MTTKSKFPRRIDGSNAVGSGGGELNSLVELPGRRSIACGSFQQGSVVTAGQARVLELVSGACGPG